MKRGGLLLVAAITGGVLGCVSFLWVVKQGFYALILPGALTGLGAGLVVNRSKPLAVVCGVIGLLMGLFAEWKAFPFVASDSLGYFLTHLHQLRGLTILLLLAGAFIAFWVPFRRAGAPRRSRTIAPAE